MHKHCNIPHIYKPLLPLAWIYGAVASLRNKLFDRGILPVEEFDIPIITVGNITAGGTGKTPLIEYLIELLSPHYRVAVLSRGYGRHSKGFARANEHSSALTLGDEPYQIYSKYSHITVAVDANRRRGIKHLLQTEPKPEIILLDDALQHRYVRPTLTIALCDYNRPIYADLVLPAGRLREPMSGIKRADIILITKCPHRLSQKELTHEAQMLSIENDRIFAAHIGYQELKSYNNAPLDTTQTLKDRKVIILCGIANPTPLYNYIAQYTSQISLHAYPDHHTFDSNTVNKICQKALDEDAIIITTEKDAARLRSLQLSNKATQAICVLPLKTIVQDEAFDNYILNKIR